jgi:surface antigen
LQKEVFIRTQVLRKQITLLISTLRTKVPSIVSFLQQFSPKEISARAPYAMVAVVALGSFGNSLFSRAHANDGVILTDPALSGSISEAIGPYTTALDENAQAVALALDSNNASFVGGAAALPSEFTHTVQKGETLSSIANSFGVTVATVLDANGIDPKDAGSVHQGVELIVPAQTTSTDQTWLSIANEEARKAAEAKARAEAERRLAQARSSRGGRGSVLSVLGRISSGGNSYPYGWCTYWVASKRYVPARWGNAKNWLNSARAAGYATGSTPQAGAIVVTTDNRFYGHVAYVESESGDSITVSEMNYVGWGRVNTRSIPKGSSTIRGYVY